MPDSEPVAEYDPTLTESERPDDPDRLNPDAVRRLSIDEFTPSGTATLLAIYFLILVLMWVFMYFVEFAGSGPHIMGT